MTAEHLTDAEILEQVSKDVNEEHELLHAGEHGGIDDAQHARLAALKVNIDQLWDLLRQRRGLRHAGLNPNTAQERPGSTVEHYQQ